jgi:hypothetical protein
METHNAPFANLQNHRCIVSTVKFDLLMTYLQVNPKSQIGRSQQQ